MLKSGIEIAILALVFSILLSLSLFSVQHVIRGNCNQIQKIDRNVIASIDRAKKALPANAYFKRHPDELRKQLKELSRERSEFQPQNCTSLFNPFS